MSDRQNEKTLLQAYSNQETKSIPFWFMRQAGRYLPEYRALRSEAGGFLDMVYHPERASEVTLQPIRRYGMHGAILFSDILVIPQALGQDLTFVTGEGPKLDALKTPADIDRLSTDHLDQTLSPIYETVRLNREKLRAEKFDDTALIGFAGSPWTVACYMIEGGGSKDFAKVIQRSKDDPQSFQKLIDIVTDATIHYLSQQAEAGVEAMQLFDSWSGLLQANAFEKWVITPTKKIVAALKEKYPNLPIVGFPRLAGGNYITYAQKTGVDVIGTDYDLSPSWIAENLQDTCVTQGNLDPNILLEGGEALKQATENILRTLSAKPFVFNLGHGVIKETPPEHVQQLAEIIRNYR